MGRPSLFTQELADEICEGLIEGKSLRSICLADDMPSTGTVCRWLASNAAFREQYERARDAQADTLADELIDIADGRRAAEDGNDPDVQRDRLSVDARKWIASKLKPKKYGDKTLIGSDPENPLPDSFAVRLVPSAKGD